VPTNQGCELEPVEVRHADIDDYQSDVVLQQALERFASRRCFDQCLVHPCENDLVAQELRLLVVDQQDLHFVRLVGRRDS